MPPAPDAAKPTIQERFQTLSKEYGALALLVYLALFLASLAGFSAAIEAGLREPLSQRLGVPLEGAGSKAGTLLTAWALSKAIQIPRILATLVLAPLLGRLPPVRRRLERAGRKP